MKPPVIVAVATRAEARLLARTGARLRLVEVGPGMRGRNQLHAALKGVQAGGLVSLGFAGGLDPVLLPGTILLPRRVVDETGSAIAVSPSWQTALSRILAVRQRISQGDLLTAQATVCSSAGKLRLGRHTGAAAVDLESAGLAAVAAELSLPFVVLRVVLDGAGDTLPADASVLLSPEGRARPIAALLTLLRSPRRSCRLLWRYRHASRALQRAIAEATVALVDPPGSPDGAFAGSPWPARAEPLTGRTVR